jgi:hypothetical protein
LLGADPSEKNLSESNLSDLRAPEKAGAAFTVLDRGDLNIFCATPN